MRTMTNRRAKLANGLALLAGILLALSAPARAQTITAEPQTVIVAKDAAQGATTITWDAGAGIKNLGATLWQQIDGRKETLVAAKAKGSKSILIGAGETRVFKLRSFIKSKVLASVTVTAKGGKAVPNDAAPDDAAPTITAKPQTVLIPAGQKSGKTVLRWDAGAANPGAEVWLAIGNVVDEFFAAGAKGMQTVAIEAGKTYTFNLYKDKNAQDPLASVVVTGKMAADGADGGGLAAPPDDAAPGVVSFAGCWKLTGGGGLTPGDTWQ